MDISNRMKMMIPVIFAVVVFTAGCLHRSRDSIPGNLYLFARFSSNRQSTEIDRLSQAVAVSALVALEMHRKAQRWPDAEAVIAGRVASLHPEAWLEHELSGIEIVQTPNADAITFIRKDTNVILTTVDANGEMETPLASPLLKPSSDSIVVRRGTDRDDFIGFLLEQLESPIVK